MFLVPCFLLCFDGGRCLASLTSCAGSNGKMLASARQCTNLQVENVDQQFLSADEAMIFSSPEAARHHPQLAFSVMLRELEIRSHQEGKRLISNRYGLLK